MREPLRLSNQALLKDEPSQNRCEESDLPVLKQSQVPKCGWPLESTRHFITETEGNSRAGLIFSHMNEWFLLASVNVGQKSKRRDISSSNHCNTLKEGGHGWHPCLQKQGREWDLATGDCETEASPGQPSFKKRLGRPRGILGRLSLEAMAAYHNVYQSLLLQWTSRS